MNKYVATVRVGGTAVNTLVFADSSTHARLLIQYQFGFNSLLSGPSQANETLEKYSMFDDLIKAQPPLSPEKTRIQGLKQNIEREKKQLKAERDRQKLKKAQQQIFKATH